MDKFDILIQKVQDYLTRSSEMNREAQMLLAELSDKYVWLTKRMDKIGRISDTFQAQLKDLNEKLFLQSTTDQLTGIANRRLAMERLEEEVQRAERYGQSFSILLGDVDYFKKINDLNGHSCGDNVLKIMAEKMRSRLRTTDLLARWGGEEFLVIMPQTTPDAAVEVGEALRRSISEAQFDCEGLEITTTISFGVCGYEKGDRLDTVLIRADEALYLAKSRGRNRVEKYDPAISSGK